MNREITFAMNSLLVFVALAIVLQTEGSPVKLIDAGRIEVGLGDRLTLNCSSSSYYTTEFLEIGQQLTIDEKLLYEIPQHGNPAVSYVPVGCQHSAQEIQCCKVLQITVVQSMDGRSYQCRASENQGDQDVYYSRGGHLLIRQGISVTPSAVLTTATIPSTAVKSSQIPQVSCLPNMEITVPNFVPSLSDELCECSGSAGVFSLPLVLALPVAVCSILF